jgi:hypothetical protein
MRIGRHGRSNAKVISVDRDRDEARSEYTSS